ncbi:hypothetical protein SUGI_0627080 [Cryptomeria japonica]|nr:hypothetical protein SUGI_0627080 [Cryptomeria japonica]
MPRSFRTNSKSSTSHKQNERQTDKPELENASDREGLMHGTEEVDELVSSQCKSSNRNKAGSGGRGRGGSGRKRFARGPRSGNNSISMLAGWEDHRVVSTEYQWWAGGAEVEVVMKVTLMAAGFVIGTRGASVREIGQATGAVVQSWTETDWAHPTALPVRLFRIQGNKRAVQAAVYVIQEAVAKYRALCECKSREEFVQREHVINGIEFFYQPPPKMALPRLKNSSHSLNLSRNHAWSMPNCTALPLAATVLSNLNTTTVLSHRMMLYIIGI